MLFPVGSAKLAHCLAASGFAAAALLAGGMAQAADRPQFDLVCAGTNAHIDSNPQTTYEQVKAPIRMRLSVDLKAGRWCYRDTGCRMTLPIASVEGRKIRLMSVKTPLNEVNFDVDRVSGAYVRRTLTPQYGKPLVSEGRCVSARFTPLS
jgi:hypothetical protein